jgi:hypothetical protein
MNADISLWKSSLNKSLESRDYSEKTNEKNPCLLDLLLALLISS